MDSYRELGERLKGLQNRGGVLYQGIVRSIEGKTCSVEVDGLSIPEVRLRPSTTDEEEELLITPSVGSVVIIGSLSGELRDLVVLSVDRAEQIILMGGKRGGLVLVGELTDKLNTLEEEISSLKRVFSSWTPIPQDGGASLKSSIASWSSKTLTKTQKSELEHPNIKH